MGFIDIPVNNGMRKGAMHAPLGVTSLWSGALSPGLVMASQSPPSSFMKGSSDLQLSSFISLFLNYGIVGSPASLSFQTVSILFSLR